MSGIILHEVIFKGYPLLINPLMSIINLWKFLNQDTLLVYFILRAKEYFFYYFSKFSGARSLGGLTVEVYKNPLSFAGNKANDNSSTQLFVWVPTNTNILLSILCLYKTLSHWMISVRITPAPRPDKEGIKLCRQKTLSWIINQVGKTLDNSSWDSLHYTFSLGSSR